MASKKRGLGKGLSALIDDNLEEKILEQTNSGVIYIKVSDIEPNKSQPRKEFNEDLLNELAESIKQYGIIQPLVVIKKGRLYEIIAGERRWRASKIAGIEEVPVIIKEFDEEEILAVSLIENIQRENLNPIEEALAYQRLLKEYKLKQDEIAKKVSKSRSTIANTLRLLNLNEKVQQMISEGMISEGHGRTLLGIEDKDLQYEIAYKIFDENLSVRETERFIKNLLKEPKIKEEKDNNLNIIIRDFENKIQELLGTKVSIKDKGRNKGSIQIEYYSNEELERIIELLSQANNKENL